MLVHACPALQRHAAQSVDSTFRISQQWQFPENNPDGDLERHQNLIIFSMAHCQPSLKISCRSVREFLRKVANRQTDRQTDKQRRGGGNKLNWMGIVPCKYERRVVCCRKWSHRWWTWRSGWGVKWRRTSRHWDKDCVETVTRLWRDWTQPATSYDDITTLSTSSPLAAHT